MSDPQGPMGEPVEEPTPVADVVSQAHEGLAEAEAVRRDSAVEPAADAADEPAFATPALNDAHAADADAAPADAAADDASAPTRAEPAYTEPAYAEPAYAEPVSAEPAYASVEPAPVASPVLQQPQPIFVQAPEEPRPRGNRAAAGGVGLIAAVCFAVLYLAAGAVIGLVGGTVTADSVGTWLGQEITTWGMWVPTAVFFLAFWLLGAIINRGRWGVWVIFGVLVGLAAYGGHLLGQLFEAPFWAVSAEEGGKIVSDQLFAPLAVVAFVIGRELTVWFSAWVSARGKRMTELNIEARREYERTLEAGPQLAER